ncbi:MAG: ATP-dependent RecD-like DNA helicase, partial [Clostridiales Family XIII bacterium]|nr:ATP-dependent RecD-like DNA helicase [Clostridiales Family XIII bacterium]
NLLKAAYNELEVSPKRICFVGDKDQLPSIDIGCPFEAMLSSFNIAKTSLVKIFRQAQDSLIIKNATKIRDGGTDIEFSNEEFCFIEEHDTKRIKEIAIKAYLKLREKDKDVILLSPLRVAKDYVKTTSEELNLEIRDIVNPRREEEEVFYIKEKSLELRTGDKIMYLKNEKIKQKDKTVFLTNGDIGVVVEAKREGILAFFEDEEEENQYVFLDNKKGKHINLSYAMSIHKAQGSEYKQVVMIIDPLHKRMLKRNLIYTGITRAKQRCVIIGDKGSFIKGIETVETGKRETMLLTYLNEMEKSPKELLLKEQMAFSKKSIVSNMTPPRITVKPKDSRITVKPKDYNQISLRDIVPRSTKKKSVVQKVKVDKLLTSKNIVPSLDTAMNDK